jgi:hypothetical protein
MYSTQAKTAIFQGMVQDANFNQMYMRLAKIFNQNL